MINDGRPYAEVVMTRRQYGTSTFITGEWIGDECLPIPMGPEFADDLQGYDISPFSLRVIGYSPENRWYVAVRRDAMLSEDDIAAIQITYGLESLAPSWELTHASLVGPNIPGDRR